MKTQNLWCFIQASPSCIVILSIVDFVDKQPDFFHPKFSFSKLCILAVTIEHSFWNPNMEILIFSSPIDRHLHIPFCGEAQIWENLVGDCTHFYLPHS